MATAGNSVSIPADPIETVIFDAAADDGPCIEFFIGVQDPSSGPKNNRILVNIPIIHKAGEFVGIPVGVALIFEEPGSRYKGLIIDKVIVKGDGGVSVIDFGIRRRNSRLI